MRSDNSEGSSWTDLVLLVEGKQAFLLLRYHTVFQYPLGLSEPLHERVDKAIKFLSLMRTDDRDELGFHVQDQLPVIPKTVLPCETFYNNRLIRKSESKDL